MQIHERLKGRARTASVAGPVVAVKHSDASEYLLLAIPASTAYPSTRCRRHRHVAGRSMPGSRPSRPLRAARRPRPRPRRKNRPRKCREEGQRGGKRREEVHGQADPATVEDLIGAEKLQEDFFQEGQWKPAWSKSRFVSCAVWAGAFEQRAGRRRLFEEYQRRGQGQRRVLCPCGVVSFDNIDQYGATANQLRMLPLGAAFPEMTVLKYGG